MAGREQKSAPLRACARRKTDRKKKKSLRIRSRPRRRAVPASPSFGGPHAGLLRGSSSWLDETRRWVGRRIRAVSPIGVAVALKPLLGSPHLVGDHATSSRSAPPGRHALHRSAAASSPIYAGPDHVRDGDCCDRHPSNPVSIPNSPGRRPCPVVQPLGRSADQRKSFSCFQPPLSRSGRQVACLRQLTVASPGGARAPPMQPRRAAPGTCWVHAPLLGRSLVSNNAAYRTGLAHGFQKR